MEADKSLTHALWCAGLIIGSGMRSVTKRRARSASPYLAEIGALIPEGLRIIAGGGAFSGTTGKGGQNFFTPTGVTDGWGESLPGTKTKGSTIKSSLVPSGTPAGVQLICRIIPVVPLALHHRLLSAIPPG